MTSRPNSDSGRATRPSCSGRSGAPNRGQPGARLRLVLGGVVLCLALLWRPDLVVGIGLAGIALLWRRWGRDLLVPLVAGVALGVAPILVHLVMAGPGNVVEGMFLQPVFELRGGRHLPIPPSWEGSFDFASEARGWR